jgi:hypothetical protein
MLPQDTPTPSSSRSSRRTAPGFSASRGGQLGRRLAPGLASLLQLRSLGRIAMLFLVFLLLILWALGMVTSYTLGGLLHILLVIALVLFLVHLIQGRPIGDA